MQAIPTRQIAGLSAADATIVRDLIVSVEQMPASTSERDLDAAREVACGTIDDIFERADASGEVLYSTPDGFVWGDNEGNDWVHKLA